MLYQGKQAQGARLVTKEVKAAEKLIGTASAKYVDAVNALDAANDAQRAASQELSILEAGLAVAQVDGSATDEQEEAVNNAKAVLQSALLLKSARKDAKASAADYLKLAYNALSSAQDEATRAQWEAVEREAVDLLHLAHCQYCAAGSVTDENLQRARRSMYSRMGFVGSVNVLGNVVDKRLKQLQDAGVAVELDPPAPAALWRSPSLKNNVYSVETPHYSQLIQGANSDKDNAHVEAQTLGEQVKALRADVATLDAQIEKIIAGGLDVTPATDKRANLKAQLEHKESKRDAALAEFERFQEKVERLESAQQEALNRLNVRTKRAQLNEANLTFSHGLAKLLAASVLFASVFGVRGVSFIDNPSVGVKTLQELELVRKSIDHCF